MQTSTQNNHENHTFKNSRKLTAPQLTPDVLRNTGGYLAVPNQLLNCAKYGLKPAHLAILLYLLAKPALTATGEQWRVNYTHMAEQLGIGETYAPKYVTYLHEKGFLEIVRLESGETEWHVKIPEHFITAPVAVPPEPEQAPIAEPQRENSHGENIHVENVAALYINKELDKTKETTNAAAAVVVEEVAPLPLVEVKELPIPASFTESEVKTAKRELAKLPSHALQIAVLAQTAQAILTKKARTPFKYLLGLINLALKGEFDIPPTPENAEAIKKAQKNDQERKIQSIVNRNKERIIADLEVKGFVHFHGLGNFTRDALKPYLQ